jgi:hypothetical protein
MVLIAFFTDSHPPDSGQSSYVMLRGRLWPKAEVGNS